MPAMLLPSCNRKLCRTVGTTVHVVIVLPPHVSIHDSHLLQLHLRGDNSDYSIQRNYFKVPFTHLKRLGQSHKVLLHCLAVGQVLLQRNNLVLQFIVQLLEFALKVRN